MDRKAEKRISKRTGFWKNISAYFQLWEYDTKCVYGNWFTDWSDINGSSMQECKKFNDLVSKKWKNRKVLGVSIS